MTNHRSTNSNRTNRPAQSPEDRVAALQARRASVAALPASKRRHPAQNARRAVTVASFGAIFGVAGVMALANTSATTAAASTNASTSATSAASGLKSTSATSGATLAATPAPVAVTKSHGS